MSLKKEYITSLFVDKHHVSVFLSNGVCLKGLVVSGDEEALILSANNINQLVMVSAIATILPREHVDLS